MNSNTRLQMILADTPIDTVLPAIAQLNLPNWWNAQHKASGFLQKCPYLRLA
jgi:hypothetical protein